MIDKSIQEAKREEKERVRRRMKVKVDPTKYEYIPAKQTLDYYDNEAHLRVVIYVRVSTDNVKQTTSFELQKKYYEDFVTRHPNWDLVAIYQDATVIIGLKQNPTIGRRFSPIFLLKSGILWGKTQNATTKQGGKLNMVWAKAFAVCLDNERLLLYPQYGGIYERNNHKHSFGRASPISRPPFRSARR